MRFFIVICIILAVCSKAILFKDQADTILQNQAEGIHIIKEDTSLQSENQQLYHYYNEKITRPYGFLIRNVFYHNETCFTQGLLVDPNTENLIESCGQYGRSYVTIYNAQKKKVYYRKSLPPSVFGEGIGLLDDTLLALSWREKKGFVFHLEKNKLQYKNTISYKTSNGEGWGLTSTLWNDQQVYVVSDGSCNLMLWDKESFSELSRKCIHDPFNNNQPIIQINELESINGLIYANIWMESRIAVIDYEKGIVVNWIDFSILKKWIKQGGDSYQQMNRVLNGIAYNSNTGSLFITGKLWNRLFEIELIA